MINRLLHRLELFFHSLRIGRQIKAGEITQGRTK